MDSVLAVKPRGLRDYTTIYTQLVWGAVPLFEQKEVYLAKKVSQPLRCE